MKKLSYLVLALVSITIVSCNGGFAGGSDAQVDSLQAALEQRNADYQQLDEFMTIISSGLDSIAAEEYNLLNPDKESPAPNQATIKAQLAKFKETLSTQRQRIASLEKQLGESKGNAAQLRRIVDFMKKELSERETQVANLQKELKDKNVTIDGLRQYMEQLTQQNASQQSIITSQNQVIADQDNMLNEAYVIIASKKDLKAAGLLKSRKLNANGVDPNLAKVVDIRTTTEILIDSKNPKIITQMPNDSYTLEKQDKKTLLKITNTGRFWSVSRYLVIQAD